MMNKAPIQVKNIAVCFSGEPRMYNLTHESIHQFFNIPDVNVKFFAHTWNSNTYKFRTDDGKIEFHSEDYDRNFIREDIEKFYNFEKLEVDYKFPNILPWDNLFYSDARVNLMKKEYELEHDFVFDLVVKCRFDLAFDPRINFMNTVRRELRLHDKTIYSHNFLMSLEFFLPNIDDVFYYGTSFTMDLIQGGMYNVCRDIYHEFVPEDGRDTNPFYDIAGPGVLMYKWLAKKNIMTHNIYRPFVIYRKQSIPFDPLRNYQEMCRKVAGIA